MRDWVKKTLLASGALRIAGNFQGPSAAILMYHSVLPNPSLQTDYLGGIVHSESAFGAQMEVLARDYHPISLDEIVEIFRNNLHLPKRAVVITFDDGYADSYEVAMPILDRFAIPATFYATVDCIEKRKLPWPSRLRFAFRRTKLSACTDPLGKVWDLHNPPTREEAFLAACDLCSQLSGAAQEELVSHVELELQTCVPDHSGSLMMSYDQLRGLTRHGHVVGSHTMTHPNMAYVKDDEAHREFALSKQLLESQLNVPIRHFSYPCPALSPHWNERTIEQSRAIGYETGITTNNGLTHSGDNLLCLNRIRPDKTVEGLRWNLENAFAGRAV